MLQFDFYALERTDIGTKRIIALKRQQHATRNEFFRRITIVFANHIACKISTFTRIFQTIGEVCNIACHRRQTLVDVGFFAVRFGALVFVAIDIRALERIVTIDCFFGAWIGIANTQTFGISSITADAFIAVFVGSRRIAWQDGIIFFTGAGDTAFRVVDFDFKYCRARFAIFFARGILCGIRMEDAHVVCRAVARAGIELRRCNARIIGRLDRTQQRTVVIGRFAARQFPIRLDVFDDARAIGAAIADESCVEHERASNRRLDRRCGERLIIF